MPKMPRIALRSSSGIGGTTSIFSFSEAGLTAASGESAVCELELLSLSVAFACSTASPPAALKRLPR